MSTYPIILIPTSIQRAKNAEPNTPRFTAIEPKKVSAPPQPYETTTLITYATIGFMLSVIFLFINLGLGAISAFLSISTIAFLAWSMQKTFPERKRKHDDYVRRYPKEVQIYRQSKQRHQEEVKKVLIPENVANYRRQQLLLTLKQTEPNDGKIAKLKRDSQKPSFITISSNISRATCSVDSH